jgi:signal transduction histidine kinase
VRSLITRVRALDPRVLDAVLAAAFLVIALISLATAEVGPGQRSKDPFAYLVTIIASVSLAFRRSHPFTVMLITTSAAIGLSAMGYPEAALPFAALLAFYAVAAHGVPWRANLTLLVLAAGLGVLYLTREESQMTAGDFVGTSVLFVGVWVLGQTLRARRDRLDAAEERAARAELERDADARRAVADERLRIAQELHDVVAHSMSVIAVQAGVGAHVIDTQPEEARKALAAIEATSRSALQEMRRMLGLLRQEDDPRGPRSPAPQQADVEALVQSVRDAGVPVELAWRGDLSLPIPDSVRFAGYRILQEALTNVLKHAGRARVWVTVTLADGEASVEVIDDGRGAAATSTNGHVGHGLLGMRERVAVFGGRFEAGPRVGGGFRVFASFSFERTGSERHR